MPATGFGALSGVRVVDLTQMLAGPYCTQLLADQGAEVIKIEPLEGDGTRASGPFHADDQQKSFGGYYASINRNKRSIAINLKQAEGRKLLHRLSDSADALVENFRAGVMERLGLGFETLSASNPRLVYGCIRGFGDPRTGASPYVDWPAFDVVAQAMGGVMQINGPDAKTPMKVGPGVGDIAPAMLCAFGVSAALFSAQRTGLGQFVDVSMLDGVLALCERIVYQHSFQDAVPHPEGNRHPLLSPFGMFPAKDGAITIAAHTDALWSTLCRLIDRVDLVTDERCARASARIAHREFVYEAVGQFTSLRTKQELLAVFGGQLPFGPVYDVDDIANDPHFAARQMRVEVEHPGVDKPLAIAGIPIKMTRTPGRVVRRAPLLGEDSDAILGELGYSAAEIAVLRDTRVVA